LVTFRWLRQRSERYDAGRYIWGFEPGIEPAHIADLLLKHLDLSQIPARSLACPVDVPWGKLQSLWVDNPVANECLCLARATTRVRRID